MTSTPLATAVPEYRKLPGRAKRLFGMFVNEKQRIWIADDHLLIVTQAYYYERYKRFYLADIQALSIQKNAAGAVLNFVLLAFAAMFTSLTITGYLNDWDPIAPTLLGLVAGVFCVCTLINVAFGPTCHCHVLTAVHEEALVCLGRYYTAQRVVEYLRGVIESVQGATTGNEQETAEQAARAMRAADRRGEISPVRQDSGRLHQATFALLIADALFNIVLVVNRDLVPSAAFIMSNVILVGLVLSAIIRQRDSDVPRSLRSTAWAAFVFNGILLFIKLYIVLIMQMMLREQDANVKDVASTVESGFVIASAGIGLLLNSIMGATGLYYFGLWRRAVRAQWAQTQAAAPESTGGEV